MRNTNTSNIAASPNQKNKLRLPPQVGPYTLSSTMLGVGTFSVVHLGYNSSSTDGEPVAVKILPKSEVARSTQLREDLRREIALLQSLRHPNIVRLYAALEDEGFHYLVFEYASCGDLFSFMGKHSTGGRLPLPTVRALFRQLFAGLAYLHKSGVAHRDLKLENILVAGRDSTAPRVLIADFGFATAFRHGELLGDKFCGSPFTVAPEIVMKRPYSGPSVDLWSAGVLLYAAVFGRWPFDAKKTSTLFGKIARGKFRFPRLSNSTNGELESVCAVISNLLVVDPKKRLSAEEVLSMPFFALDQEREEGEEKENINDDSEDDGEGQLADASVDTMRGEDEEEEGEVDLDLEEKKE